MSSYFWILDIFTQIFSFFNIYRNFKLLSSTLRHHEHAKVYTRARGIGSPVAPVSQFARGTMHSKPGRLWYRSFANLYACVRLWLRWPSLVSSFYCIFLNNLHSLSDLVICFRTLAGYGRICSSIREHAINSGGRAESLAFQYPLVGSLWRKTAVLQRVRQHLVCALHMAGSC